MKKLPIIAMLALASTGCEQTRSFMQMDSNSGAPFMGVQLSVEAQQNSDLSPGSDQPEIERYEWLRTASSKKASPDFVLTSRSKQSSGNLKFSLPEYDLSNDSEIAAEVQDILNRM